MAGVRRMALVTCVAIVISLPIPMWTAMQAALETQAGKTVYGWVSIILAWLFAAVLPLFYFALYRNRQALHISRLLRLVSLAGALAGGIVLAAAIPLWLGSDHTWLTTVKMALSGFVDAACIVLLCMFFHGTSDLSQAGYPISKLLRIMTRTAVAAGAFWFAINLAAFFSAVVFGARQTGSIRTLLEQVCLFTAPAVVYWSSLRGVGQHGAGRLRKDTDSITL